MPWSNSWSGSGGVVANSVEVINQGTVVAQINNQGVGSFSEIVDNGSLIVGGTDLETTIGNLPLGVIAWGSHVDNGSSWGTGMQGPIATVSWTSSPNRIYAVYAMGLEIDVSVVGASVEAALLYQNNGTVPTPSSPTALGSRANLSYGRSTWSGAVPTIVGWFYPNAVYQLCCGLFIGNGDGNNASVSTWAGYTNGWVMWVEDKGSPATGNGQGVAFYTPSTPPPPPPQQHQFSRITNASISYQGGGAASNGSGSAGQWMYYGEDPGYAPNGNWRSYCWFDSEPGILDMAGYSSVSQLDLYVYVDWSYPIAGNTIYIGFHNEAGVPGTEPPGSTYQVLSFTVSGRGQGQWVSLLGATSIMNAVHAGTIRGFVLGPGPNTSYNYYGYASGVNGVNPISLRATYYK